jgi:hypothetical protein
MDDTQVLKTECAAPHCPMAGTSTRKIGSGEWLCHIHLGAHTDRWHAVTLELNRLAWLVAATRAIRAYADDAKQWAEVGPRIYKKIELSQRGDLQQKMQDENRRQWGIRLENVLAESCAQVGKQEEVPA